MEEDYVQAGVMVRKDFDPEARDYKAAQREFRKLGF